MTCLWQGSPNVAGCRGISPRRDSFCLRLFCLAVCTSPQGLTHNQVEEVAFTICQFIPFIRVQKSASLQINFSFVTVGQSVYSITVVLSLVQRCMHEER